MSMSLSERCYSRQDAGRRLARYLPFVVLSLTACAHPFYATRIRPAEIDLHDIKSIAVYKIDGEDGPTLESALTEGLVASKRFDVLDRDHLAKVLEEQHMSVDAAVPAEMRKLGAILPAAAVITGKVLDLRYDESQGTKQSSCAVSQGNKIVMQPCTIYVRTGVATYVADVKLISVESGAVLAAREISSRMNQSQEATGGPAAAIDKTGLLTSCRTDATQQFLRMVAPFSVQEQVDFESDSDVPELDYGNRYLRAGDRDSAVEKYRDAVESADARPDLALKTRAKAHYSLALGLALSGEYPAALEEIKEANKLSGEGKWIEFETRIKTWQQEADKLSKQSTAEAVVSSR